MAPHGEDISAGAMLTPKGEHADARVAYSMIRRALNWEAWLNHQCSRPFTQMKKGRVETQPLSCFSRYSDD